MAKPNGPVFAPGEVVRIALDPSKGSEQQKTRPCLVVSDSSPLGLVVVLPITDGDGKRGRLFVPIPDIKTAGLTKASVVDCFQIRCIDPTERAKGTMGTVGDDVMSNVRAVLADVLGIDEEHTKE